MLSPTEKQRRAERKRAIYTYFNARRPACQSDQHAAWITGAHFGVTSAHVLYVVKEAKSGD